MSGTLFISDLHLASERPQIHERFFDFLRTHAARASSVYILGDLFEIWLGDDALEDAADPLACAVAQALGTLGRSGVGVRILRGNRDFLLGARFCERACAELLEDPTVIEVQGQPVLISHGDSLCTEDLDYQAWRCTARSPAWQRDFLARPLAERRALALGLREKSREVTRAKAAQIMDVSEEAVRAAFRAHRVGCMIHGHTHRPARHEHEVDGRRCERWVLPDWYECGGYLAWDAAGPRLVSL